MPINTLAGKPAVLTQPFCWDGDRVPLPATGDEHSIDANQQSGFPPPQGQPIASGGKEVRRDQMNGVLNRYTQVDQYATQGGSYTWDAEIGATGGGYPEGAQLYLESSKRMIISKQDANTQNPNTTLPGSPGSLWEYDGAYPEITESIDARNGAPYLNINGSIDACAIGGLSTGGTASGGLYFTSPSHSANGHTMSLVYTGNYTSNTQGSAGAGLVGINTSDASNGHGIYFRASGPQSDRPYFVSGDAQSACQFIDGPGSSDYRIPIWADKANWAGNTAQTFDVAPAVAGTQAVNLSQLNTKADLAGNAGVAFNVADPTQPQQAVPLHLLQSVAGTYVPVNTSISVGQTYNLPRAVVNVVIIFAYMAFSSGVTSGIRFNPSGRLIQSVLTNQSPFLFAINGETSFTLTTAPSGISLNIYGLYYI